MRKFIAAGAALTLAVAASADAAVFYEPFDYATGQLAGNVNPSVNKTWYSSITSGADDRVQVSTGSLSSTGMPASVGNMATYGDSGRTDRIAIGPARNTGQVYYSLMMNVTDLTGAAAGGATIFGFNNTEQNADDHSIPTAISGRLLVKPIDATAGTYQIGASKAGANAANFVFTPLDQPFDVNETVLIVGRYTFVTQANTSDDVFEMWINPSPATFEDDSLIPAADLSSANAQTPGTDGGQIATILLRQADNIVPAGLQFDEIRADRTWAHVTSNLVPEPASLGLLAAAGVFIRRRKR